MKITKIQNLFILVFGLIMAFSSCEDAENQENYLSINGTKYELNTNSIINKSWQADEFGTFETILTASISDEDISLSFRLISPQKNTISTGTYNYSWWPDNSFTTTLPILQRSNDFEISEKNYSWTGFVSINGTEPNFELTINLEAVNNLSNESFLIKGKINEFFTVH